MNQILLQETEKVLNGKLTKDDFIKIMLERCTV